MTRFAKRPDDNQEEIVDELRAHGYKVIHYFQCGFGISDIVMCKDGRCEWVEIKSSPKEDLTKAEKAFFAICPGGPPILAWTAALAMAEFERRRQAALPAVTPDPQHWTPEANNVR